VYNRALVRSLTGSVLVLAVTVAGCSSSSNGAGNSGAPTGSPSPSETASSQGHGPIHLNALMLPRIISGGYKIDAKASAKLGTGFTAASLNDPRKHNKASHTLHRDRFRGTYQRAWTGFGGSTIQISLSKFKVPGGATAYQGTLIAVLKRHFGTTATPVSVPGVPSAVGVTHKTNKQQTTIIMAIAGRVVMLVRAAGKVALGQVPRTVTVAKRQFTRL
jgi:hypothetical protein